jgi:hypothetical protein
MDSEATQPFSLLNKVHGKKASSPVAIVIVVNGLHEGNLGAKRAHNMIATFTCRGDASDKRTT